MKAGIVCLVLAYVFSQFYRAFLAVLTPVLQADIGVTAEDLAAASGLWFLAFGALQLPVGVALDRVGPRLTTALLFIVGGAGGALAFAFAQGPGTIKLAMMLIGVGCSPVLMAAYYIFARLYSPAVFGTLAGALVGMGNLGNIGSSLPLALAVEAFGWRTSVLALAAVTLAIGIATLFLLRDPPKVVGGARGSLMDLLRLPAIWFIIPMIVVCYFPAAAIRGLWVGPFYADVYGADAAMIGKVTLAMGFAMILGNFAYGPLDRILGTRKWLIFGGNLAALACLAALWAFPLSGPVSVALMLAALGFFGASFPMMMAHGRAFFPPHLVGRGVTLLNLFSLGAAGLAQYASGWIHAGAARSPVEAAYTPIFAVFAITLAIGLVIYAFSEDRTD
ncbi:MAG: MFS transporter [Pseudorhodobacter sp.]